MTASLEHLTVLLEYIIDLMKFLADIYYCSPTSCFILCRSRTLIGSFSFNVQIEKQSPVHGPGVVETQKLMACCDNYMPDHIIM